MGLFPSSTPQDTQAHEDAATYWIGRLLVYHPALLPYLRDLLDVVIAHIPRVVAGPVLKLPTPGPIGLSLVGTVMFADIDGFTPLAERFSQAASQEGAEELTELVNRFLEILIRVTSRYGGDLQKFGGDAGMVLFQGEDHAFRAVAAGAEVQRVMKKEMGKVETSLGCFPLEVSIGLGSGQVVGLGLGDVCGRDWSLIGTPLEAMGRAQCAAPPGETLVDSETLVACGGGVVSVEVEEGLYQIIELERIPNLTPFFTLPMYPELDDPSCVTWFLSRIDALAPYLAPGLLERLVTAPTLDRTRLWSEHRLVTVMMFSLPTFFDVSTYWGDEERLQKALERSNEAFIQIRDTILRYDGIVNKVGIGPQGPYGMALFGAPRAYEDDPLRAVLSALELQELFGSTLRFGINTGYVFAGDMGVGERREYTVMGDEVNLAYRLMSECKPGEVWLGPTTNQHASVRYRVAGEMGPETHFKGKKELITPFIVQGLRRTVWGALPAEIDIVGRDEELAELSLALRDVQRGCIKTVLLHGDAGVGKSRLTQEVARLAEEMGFAVHTGAAPSYGLHLPLAVWESLHLSLFDLEEMPLEDRPAALSVALARYELGTWAALLAPLAGLELPPSQDLLSLPADQREAQRHEVLQELWEKAARQQPRLLIFENAHWMAPTSLALLDVLLEMDSVLPLMILITYRDEPSVENRWTHLSKAMDISLEPFSTAAMRTLVQGLFQETPLPAAVREWIVERSRGLPLFATEAVRTLMDSGLLHRRDDSWELIGSLADFPLPDMVYSLIQSRIDQLSPPTRHLLRAASVVGDEMTLPMLAAAYGDEPASAIRRRLPELLPFGLVPRDIRGEMLSFHQPLIREVAYRGLPQRVKRLIHQRISEYLDYSKDGAMPNWLNLLAYHTLEGHLWERAITANLELGKRALQAYLVPQALESLQNVLFAAENGGVEAVEARFEAHHYLCEALILLGQHGEALMHLDEARALLPTTPTAPEDLMRLADLEYHQATLFEVQGEYDRALEAVVRGLSLPGVEKMIEGLRLYLLGADLFRRANDYQQAQAWAQRSVALSTHFVTPEAQQLRSRAMYMLALLASLQRLQK